MLKIGRISFAVLIAAGAFMATPLVSAQTQQTDQSEEDWRNSQKKPGSDDIFEDIRNNRTTGSGSVLYGPPNPLDSLPEESRRHLTRERAKALATGDPNTVGDTPYTPSEAAKSDPNLEQQEKEVWEAITSDLKGAGQGAGQQGQGSQGQGQQGQQGQAGSQGQSGQDGNSNQRSSSVLRGGSSASVAEILAGIKGRSVSGGGSGTSPQGTSPQGTSPQGTSPQGTSPQGTSSQGTSPQGTGQQGSGQDATGQQDGGGQQDGSAQDGAGQPDGTGQQDGSAQDGANSSADGSQGDANNGDANASGAQAGAATDGGGADAANPPQGPLERLKERNAEREDEAGGQRTNAFDFIRSKTSGD